MSNPVEGQGLEDAAILLMSLGVWLGLIPRFNSWDALLRPLEVLGADELLNGR